MGCTEPDPPHQGVSSRRPHRGPEVHMCPESEPSIIQISRGHQWPVGQCESEEPPRPTERDSKGGQLGSHSQACSSPSPTSLHSRAKGEEAWRSQTTPHPTPGSTLRVPAPAAPASGQGSDGKRDGSPVCDGSCENYCGR